jgi:galactitol-specific phosphotransferase system IIB component
LESGQDTIEFINRVRQFIATNADVGNPKHPLCETFYQIPIAQLPVQQFIEIFNQDQGTASCGLASSLMVKMLLDNGVDAYSYNFGFENTRLTHVVTLARLGNSYLIFDSFLNSEPKWADGRNIDLIELLYSINDNEQMSNVTYGSDRVTSDLIIDFSAIKESQKAMVSIPACVQIVENREHLRASIYKIRVQRGFSSDTSNHYNSFVRSFEAELAKQTDYTFFHHGLAMKIHEVVGADDSETVNAMIDSIIASTKQ